MRDIKKDYIDIWIVEDNAQLRTTLEEVLESDPGMICSCAFDNVEDTIQALQQESPPQVLLLDIGLPKMSGIEALPKIKDVSPSTHIVMLTIYGDDDKVFESICAGASGYLLKGVSPEKIIESVKEVLSGGAPMSAQIARKVLKMFTDIISPKAEYALTEREKEILNLLVSGLSHKQMAAKLFLSPLTVSTHIKNIYAKLQVHSRTEAVVKALKERLI